MEFNLENELVKNGFILDHDKDERSSYLRGNMSTTLHWDGDMLDEEGKCISMTIKNIGVGVFEEHIYFGPRPNNQLEFDKLFKKLEFI